MVALIYALVAVVCLWLAARAWRERSPPGAAAFALLAAQAGASSLLFGLYLSGLSFFVYPYAAITAFVPVSLMRVFERLFGDPHPSPRWVRLRVVTAVVVVAYGVTEPFLGGALRASVPEVVLGAYVVLAFVMPLGRLWRGRRGGGDHAARGGAPALLAVAIDRIPGRSLRFSALVLVLASLGVRYALPAASKAHVDPPPPPPPGCVARASRADALGVACKVTRGLVTTPCPEGYSCTLGAGTSTCEIHCGWDCECPPSSRCVEHSCRR